MLLYDGKVATTFFFSSSGGRTAAITDVVLERQADALPRLGARPVRHVLAVPQLGPGGRHGDDREPERSSVPGLTDLRTVPAKGHARSIVATGRNGDVTVSRRRRSARALGLRSTWITVGVLSLSRPAGDVAAGLAGDAHGLGQRGAEAVDARAAGATGGAWQPGPALTLQSGRHVLGRPSRRRRRRSTGSAAGTVKSAALEVAVVAT